MQILACLGRKNMYAMSSHIGTRIVNEKEKGKKSYTGKHLISQKEGKNVSSEYIKYLLVLLLLVIVLGMYINNFVYWTGKLDMVPLSFKLVVLYALRIMSTIVAFLNFALYIDGSYFLSAEEYTVSNVLLVAMILVVCACLIALFIVRNGFKIACTPVMHSRRSQFYEE
jgi:magnesium-transporting ATPase (P-type)